MLAGLAGHIPGSNGHSPLIFTSTDTQMSQNVRYITECPFDGNFAPRIFQTLRKVFEALKFHQSDYSVR